MQKVRSLTSKLSLTYAILQYKLKCCSKREADGSFLRLKNRMAKILTPS
jgi:hypothetical protein